MCTSLVERTSLAVRDSTDDAAEAEDSFHIRLEAHSILADRSAEEAEAIEERFRTNGRAALRIGQRLELAEAKRRQCESASMLVRRWWQMESLAEHEDASGEEIRVDDEVGRGTISSSSCQMPQLFTLPENGLEASKALKALRTVIRSRGNSAAISGVGAFLDANSEKRFELTGRLVQRTSAALEQRLLGAFSDIYGRGGTYDFGNPENAGRAGRLDWVRLREIADALSNFDNGRSVHRRYVQLVVTTRFPEFTKNGRGKKKQSNSLGDSDVDSDEEEFDMDTTRSELSNLFHRVSEVCTAEFRLIAHVFSAPSPASSTGGGGGYEGAPTSTSEQIPLQVARALLQRVISNPRNGLQARIDELLASIDRRGDFNAGAKKLDTFVVIHEKAAGLFGLLKDAAEQMLLVGKKGGGAEVGG